MLPIPIVPTQKRLAGWLVLLIAVVLTVRWVNRENPFAEGGRAALATPLPPFPTWEAEWIGTEPLTLEAMRGEAWVLKLWTFDCINCIRSMPYANELVDRYAGRARVLGIHSPEFEHERDLDGLVTSIAKHGLRFPTFVDLTLEYFTDLDPPGWPTFYLVDRELRIRGFWAGEMHSGTARAEALEALLDELLAEPRPQEANAAVGAQDLSTVVD